MDIDGIGKLLESWLVHDCYSPLGFSVGVELGDGFYIVNLTDPSGVVSRCTYALDYFSPVGLHGRGSPERTRLELAHEAIRRVVREYYDVPHAFVDCVAKLGYMKEVCGC